MYRYFVTLALLFIAVTGMWAQSGTTYKGEVGAGVGVTNYLGDFNGSLTKGFQPEVNIIYRRVFDAYKALKFDLSAAPFKGSSINETTYYPDYAANAYNFKRTLMDLNATYEYNFMPYGTGRDYRGAQRLTPFIFIGLGATMVTGEGETKATANMPLGIGLKYKLAERVNLGLEWAAHFTMSDELDGVKDPYHVVSSGIFKNTDCYSSLRLTLTYSIAPVCPTCNKY